ncbi:hypothetical protein [Ornithinimicrobium sp. INDO-MA30-4]|uniref:hypothetical protein n=1 Tax=Ornithinimicrobium sp. INDO-MA30-4 TaxID=2908651 RepID=UPI001F2E4F96|nr:hypothetical protein [Ornithinimicrobium sp. INDO-MA30-4]UJH70549.1 hypothetical protein L0A91_16090 [Ornithinimicrobium sp. INDO-MA30-4]
MRDALQWAVARMARSSDPRSTAHPESEIVAAAGETVTSGGIGSAEAMRIFKDVLEPATRSQGHELNLAYIPGAPNRSAVAFDAVTGSANILVASGRPALALFTLKTRCLRGWRVCCSGPRQPLGVSFLAAQLATSLPSSRRANAH